MRYSPLTASVSLAPKREAAVEPASAFWRRTWASLWQWLAAQWHFYRPRGWSVVNHELRIRNSFPSDEWRAAGHEPEAVKPILTMIAAVCNWPNAHFIPMDSLLPVLAASTNEWAIEDLAARIEKALRISIDVKALSKRVADGETISEFVTAVLDRPC